MIFILKCVISPIPSAPIALASGMAYGQFWGTVYIVIGAEAGAIIAFFIARALGCHPHPRFSSFHPPGERIS